MGNRRSYTDIVASLETHVIYITNHLQNIDAHLERQNDTLVEHAKTINKNRDRVGLIYKGIATLFTGGGVIAIVLKLCGVY